MEKKPDLASAINIPDNISRSAITVIWVKKAKKN
jgi:hypothetical protein